MEVDPVLAPQAAAPAAPGAAARWVGLHPGQRGDGGPCREESGAQEAGPRGVPQLRALEEPHAPAGAPPLSALARLSLCPLAPSGLPPGSAGTLTSPTRPAASCRCPLWPSSASSSRDSPSPFFPRFPHISIHPQHRRNALFSDSGLGPLCKHSQASSLGPPGPLLCSHHHTGTSPSPVLPNPSGSAFAKRTVSIRVVKRVACGATMPRQPLCDPGQVPEPPHLHVEVTNHVPVSQGCWEDPTSYGGSGGHSGPSGGDSHPHPHCW